MSSGTFINFLFDIEPRINSKEIHFLFILTEMNFEGCTQLLRGCTLTLLLVSGTARFYICLPFKINLKSLLSCLKLHKINIYIYTETHTLHSHFGSETKKNI